MICPKCKLPMAFFGVTEKGEDKYYCNECHRIEIDTERKRKNT